MATRQKIAVALCVFVMCLGATNASDFQEAARSLDMTIQQNYAYLEKLPDSKVPQSPQLDQEREAVNDDASLLHYAENRMASLADHHAITGSSFPDSWAVVPTYSDLWIVRRDNRYIVDAVREDSPAASAGLRVGDQIVTINRVSTAAAVAGFWAKLGLDVTQQRAEYAARVLAAGRRDRDRIIGVQSNGGAVRSLNLTSLYKLAHDAPPVTLSSSGNRSVIRINNSLGDDATIAAFDAAMAQIPAHNQLILDLRDTPSGGNTVVTRAMMGWFVVSAKGYQVHNLPEEERRTGIARQWIEQVLPRSAKYRSKMPVVYVGRWTGSMGEGLAIGFAALGARVVGDPMAGLNGSVEDFTVGNTRLTVKLPTERLMTISGQPRENFRPRQP
jgi:C-terminal processing protease CtpA/Prc